MPINNTFPTLFPLGRRFALLTKLYFGALTRKLHALEIERHYSILLLLESSEAKCNQQYISDLLKIDKASMVRIINYLVKNGYLIRETNPDDKRAHYIRLTSKAKKELPLIRKGVAGLNKIATKGLTSAQVKILYNSLDIITKNLRNEPADTILINYKKVKSSLK